MFLRVISHLRSNLTLADDVFSQAVDMEKENANGSEAATDASSVHPPNVDAITDVLKTRDWLDGQNYDLAVALKAGNFQWTMARGEDEKQITESL